MRCLERNKSPFYYALYQGETDYLINGLKTGEKVITYSQVTSGSANISPARGTSDIELFGTSLDYDRNMTFDYSNFPDLDENSILWVDATPNQAADNFDYRVVRIAKSKNWINVAIKRVSR